jgi:hypothetical protein
VYPTTVVWKNQQGLVELEMGERCRRGSEIAMWRSIGRVGMRTTTTTTNREMKKKKRKRRRKTLSLDLVRWEERKPV